MTDHFCFYHIPRTGGTWICTVLDRLGIKWWRVGHSHGTPAENPPDRFSFTVIREPETWRKSWSQLVESKPQRWGWPVPDWMFHDEPEAVFQRYTAGVDYVGRTETVRADLQHVFDACGVGLEVPDLPPVNVDR